jgi:hypothetical protein
LISYSPFKKDVLQWQFPEARGQWQVLNYYAADKLTGRDQRLSQCQYLCLLVGNVPDSFYVGFVTRNGFTYYALCPLAQDGVIRVPFSELKQGKTLLLPPAYPGFQPRFFEPDSQQPFNQEAIERVVIGFRSTGSPQTETVEMSTIWLE